MRLLAQRGRPCCGTKIFPIAEASPDSAVAPAYGPELRWQNLPERPCAHGSPGLAFLQKTCFLRTLVGSGDVPCPQALVSADKDAWTTSQGAFLPSCGSLENQS